MKKYKDIAVLPLESALLFPNMILPMQIFEENYLKLVEYALGSSKKIAITLNKPGLESEPSEGTICCLGTITFVEDVFAEEGEGEGKAIVVSGETRVKITKTTQTEPFIIVEVEEIPETCSSQTIFDRCKEVLPKLLIQYLFLKNVSDQDIHLANLIVDPAHIADFVAYYFIDDMYVKMNFLETNDVCERCVAIEEVLKQHIATAK